MDSNSVSPTGGLTPAPRDLERQDQAAPSSKPLFWSVFLFFANFYAKITNLLLGVEASSKPQKSAPVEYGFHYQDQVDKYPLGWARFAAEQNWLQNGSIHRRHGYLMQRVMYYFEGKFAWMEKELDDLESQIDSPDPRSLSAGQKEKTGEKSSELDRMDCFMHEISPDLIQYNTLVLQDQSLRELPKVSAAEFWNAYDNYVLKAEMFDEEGRLFLKQPDDFVTTQTDRTHSPLEWMIYRQQNSRLVKFLSKKGPGSFGQYIPTISLRTIFVMGVVAFSGFILLTPVSILYEVPLAKSHSLGVVAIFGLIFAMVLSAIPNIKLETVFMAMSAYLAVLTAFLANVQGSSRVG